MERASRILRGLVADNHLFLASANRVKALILEEIALDTAQMDEDTPRELLIIIYYIFVLF